MSFKRQIHKIIKLDHWITPDALTQLDYWCQHRANMYASRAADICRCLDIRVMHPNVFPTDAYAERAIERWEYNMDTPTSINRAELTISPTVCRRILHSITPCKLGKMTPIYMAALIQKDFLDLYGKITTPKKIIMVQDIVDTGEPFYWFTGRVHESRAQFIKNMPFRVSGAAAKMIQEYVEKQIVENQEIPQESKNILNMTFYKKKYPELDVNAIANYHFNQIVENLSYLLSLTRKKTVTPELFYCMLEL